jgi:iron(III) transport system ATP-binding protein
MQYSVETPIGELFVIDHRIDTPIIAGEQVAIGFSERGMAVVSGQ